MDIVVIGSGAGASLLVRGLRREAHKAQWILREGGDKRLAWELGAVRYTEDEAFFDEGILGVDAVVVADTSPSAAVLAAAMAKKGAAVYFVSYDDRLSRLLAAEPVQFGIRRIFDYGEILGKRLFRFYYEEEGMQTEVFDQFGSALIKVRVEKGDVFCGRRVRNIGALEDLVLVTVNRGGRVLMAKGDTALEEGDLVRIIGKVEAVDRFRRRYGVAVPRPERDGDRRFIVFGEGAKARAAQRALVRAGADVVTWGGAQTSGAGRPFLRDLSVTDAMEDMEVERADGFVAASEDDGMNFLTVAAARDRGQRHCAMCMCDTRLMKVADRTQAEGIFSADLLLAREIKKALLGPGDLSLHLFPGNLEIYEIVLKEGAQAAGKRIDELSLSRGFLIGGLMRKGESVTPKGYTALEAGDRLLIFLLPESDWDLRKFIPQRSVGSMVTELFSL